METGEANLPHRKFSNNLCSYSVLSEVERGLLLFKCELHVVTFFQSIQYRKSGEMSNITVEEPDSVFARWSRLAPSVTSRADKGILAILFWEWHLTSPKVIILGLTMKKVPDKSRFWATKFLFQEDKKFFSRLSRSRKTREVWATITSKRSQRRYSGWKYYGILEQLKWKDIREKLRKYKQSMEFS